jgi:D-alanyl-lipoteichoic acid acyltransferase DltB (MBOAT superfamily)
MNLNKINNLNLILKKREKRHYQSNFNLRSDKGFLKKWKMSKSRWIIRFPITPKMANQKILTRNQPLLMLYSNWYK